MPGAEQNPSDLQFIKGIGPKRAQLLAKQGITTVYDLLTFFPRRYVDRSNIVALNELMPDQEVTVMGRIEAAGIRRGGKPFFYIVVSDGKGYIEGVWFNAIPYYKNVFKVGDWVALSGKVTFYRGFQMTHPDYDRIDEKDAGKLLNTGKILAIYPGSEAMRKAGLNSYFFRRVFYNLFQKKQNLPEIFPPEILNHYRFPQREEAFRQVHTPASGAQLEAALRRLKYEEFFFIQMLLALQYYHRKEKPIGRAFTKKSERLEAFYHRLPFAMTEAQKRVVREIRRDMALPAPMNRLLQGDVGSGKTLVAVMAMLIAVDNGAQAALMAPTEILAEQHYLTISNWLEPLGVKVSLLTGSTAAAQRKQLAEELKKEQPHVVVGTHALIQDAVKFENLGLVVIDEQHRFGVIQRARLQEKGVRADVLVMTATPIPRTLALTVYGSLDVSLLDEMPANRQPVTTVWRFDDKAADIYRFITQHVRAGEQIYIVYPLVEESEKLDLKAATEAYRFLSAGPFKDFKVGLLHGRMKAAEKEEIMRLFVSGKIHILVATTVIEVGVDVPNATIMLIEHAERFGLSQLHQLRGRVGRGRKKSYCILKTPFNIGEVAQKRMRIMTETSDGFLIAEKDLELRGWGDFFGTKQSGMPDFKLANPITDREILEDARKDAFLLVQKDPQLRLSEHAQLRRTLKENWSERWRLARIS
ncbi:MAG TPA: ATP-dependent DNA helicase RecG [Caldithrix abyssi]|uniref:ATP-dependent DNA helicase RecG n=1 Tax=Caldithrix abyssi TaxID=187145 RepID=A0A7V5PP41_CALAY|nr:ATP-dependent DNA helicase RecG [Caldithrix abyssi]